MLVDQLEQPRPVALELLEADVVMETEGERRRDRQ